MPRSISFQVGEVQKLSLVGQLMGVTHFFQFNLTQPKVISLQNGRFALRYFGRFILAVGSDRNVEDSILDHRTKLLSDLLQLYHSDVERISAVYGANGKGDDQRKLTDKLYHIFETYLPLLQYNGNIFYNISILNLPKPASNFYLDTVQVLESCQQEVGVLGGQIMYHNKVIASQLSSALTHLLVISDPLRLKTIESIHVQFHVPFGVVLLGAYISSKEFNALKRSADKAKTVFINSNPNLLPFTLKKKNAPKEPILSGMKRDKSLIFTHIPEDEETVTNGGQTTNKSKNRPNHLPLKFKNMTSKELPESGFSSINFDETDSYPDFIGKTSVCSTPMTENKILHGNILSICAKTCEEFENIDNVEPEQQLKEEPAPREKQRKVKKVMGTPRKIRLPKTEVKEIDTEEGAPSGCAAPKLVATEIYTFVANPFKSQKRRNSYNDLNQMAKAKSQDEIDLEDCADVKKKLKRSNSVTDPTFCAVNEGGAPISKDLFKEFLDFQYTTFSAANNKSPKKKVSKLELMKPMRNGKSNGHTNGDTEPKKLEQSKVVAASKLSRTGLTLPLKSLNQPSEDSGGKKSLFESSTRGRLQLTPLMAKLTALAMNDERCMGNGGAGGGGELTPIDPLPVKRRPSIPRSEAADAELPDDGKLHKVDLFACGQQNMTMIVLLEENALRKHEMVQTLFEVCVSRLTKLEANLHQVLNLNVEGDKGEGNYSFMEIDNKKWGLIDKVGPWSAEDLAAVEAMHNDLKGNKNFTEIMLRSDENILYGYKSGDVEVFYQQPQSGTAGIPPPSDIMGVVSSVARRRLERDHTIVLL